MKKTEVIEYFGNLHQASKALGFRSSGTVYQWGDIVPERVAARLSVITGGKLAYNPSAYMSRKPRRKTPESTDA